MRVLLLISCFFICFTGCRKNFEEYNSNPNEPTKANVDHLFTNALLTGGGQFSTSTHTNVWTLMVWGQHMADVNGVFSTSNLYPYSDDWNDELWKEWYARVLSPTNQVIELTKDDPFLINKNAIARIWRAYTFHRIADLWGDIPYFEALQGFNDSGVPIIQPTYDKQADVYEDLLKELKEATEAMNPDKDNFLGADIIYNGNLDLWTKFANSLRLRLAMRIVEANNSLASTHINELMAADNFIASNDENADIIYNGIIRNPFYDLEVSGQGMLNPSHYFVELLKNTNDPRVIAYFRKSPSSEIFGTSPYIGVPNLKTSTELNELGIEDFTVSEVGDQFVKEDAPIVIMSYAELSFLKAEAVFRGFSGGASDASYYEDGVRSAMEDLSLPADSITNFLTGDGAYNTTLEQIITQKWITFAYQNGYEAYAEYRRTGYPKLTDLDGNDIDQTLMPKRLEYPLSEVTLNGPNVSAVGEGINDFYSPVWWNK